MGSGKMAGVIVVYCCNAVRDCEYLIQFVVAVFMACCSAVLPPRWPRSFLPSRGGGLMSACPRGAGPYNGGGSIALAQ